MSNAQMTNAQMINDETDARLVHDSAVLGAVRLGHSSFLHSSFFRHSNFVIRILIAVFVLLATGCATVPMAVGSSSDAKAERLLRQCAEAHGYAALMKAHAVHAEFEGKFSWIVPKVQPVLVDENFRGRSQDEYLLHEQTVMQVHQGTGGTKIVKRKPGEVEVSYNGKASTDADVKNAAAMVADDDRMFLLGPAFFLERGAIVQDLGTDSVDGMQCDQVLAVLKPGLGNSPADRAILSIDQKQHLLRRLRITVEGMESTRGAVADIFLRDPIRVDGVVFPTRFYEELKRPFDAAVHHWRMTGIDLQP